MNTYMCWHSKVCSGISETHSDIPVTVGSDDVFTIPLECSCSAMNYIYILLGHLLGSFGFFCQEMVLIGHISCTDYSIRITRVPMWWMLPRSPDTTIVDTNHGKNHENRHSLLTRIKIDWRWKICHIRQQKSCDSVVVNQPIRTSSPDWLPGRVCCEFGGIGNHPLWNVNLSSNSQFGPATQMWMIENSP